MITYGIHCDQVKEKDGTKYKCEDISISDTREPLGMFDRVNVKGTFLASSITGGTSYFPVDFEDDFDKSTKERFTCEKKVIFGEDVLRCTI